MYRVASQRSHEEEPPFEHGTPHLVEFQALAAAVVAGLAPETVSLPLDEELLTLTGHTDGVHRCAISADGATIVSASRDCTLKAWDGRTGAERLSLTGHEWEIRGCAFGHDGGLIVWAARDGTLKVWDSGSGACLSTLGGLGPLYDCACSFCGQHIGAVGSYGVYFLKMVQ